MFLKGRTPDLIKKNRKQMADAANVQDFERAAVLRDKIIAIEKTLERQVAMSTDLRDRDVLAIARVPEHSVITQLSIRGGYLVGSMHFTFSEVLSNDEEMIASFIRQYYEKTPFIPKEILVPVPLGDAAFIEDGLKKIKGKKVSLLWPKRGEKANLVDMAFQNADVHLKELIASRSSGMELLNRLQQHLKMKQTPIRIECFDNSNLFGVDPVAGMVVFENGVPKKNLYRKYKIKTVNHPDDYTSMAEVLNRRFGKGEASRPYPDLLMVDGGKGQLNIAVSVINELKLDTDFEIIGIAKKDETKGESKDKIYKQGRVNPISLDRAPDLLLFLQRIRDEAHRYAVSFHRKRRTVRAIHSVLDDISGIGAKRKAVLLQHFGGIEKIRRATSEELCALPGMNRRAAEAVYKALRS